MLIRSPPQKISHIKNFVPNWITQEILDVYSCISEIRRISKKNSIWMLDNRYILIIHKLNCVNRYGINEPRRISVLIVIPWGACKVRVIKLNDTITSSSNEHVVCATRCADEVASRYAPVLSLCTFPAFLVHWEVILRDKGGRTWYFDELQKIFLVIQRILSL